MWISGSYKRFRNGQINFAGRESAEALVCPLVIVDLEVAGNEIDYFIVVYDQRFSQDRS